MKTLDRWLETKPNKKQMVEMLREFGAFFNEANKLINYLNKEHRDIPNEYWVGYEATETSVVWELERPFKK